MDFKSRLKNNTILNNKKITIPFFLIVYGGAVVAFVQWINAGNKGGGFLPLVFLGICMFSLNVIGKMISVNMTTHNHRLTGKLIALCLLPIGFFITLTVVVITYHFELGVAIMFGFIWGALAIILVFDFKSGRKIKSSLVMLVIATFGAFWYVLSSFLVQNYLGNTLLIFIATALLILAVAVFFKYLEKRIPPLQKPDINLLDEKFNIYLDKVFKGVPVIEEMIGLREQLYHNLTSYAQDNIENAVSEQVLYEDAMDNLGDFSPLIYKYKKNFLSRISSVRNTTINTIILIIFEALTMQYVYASTVGIEWVETVPFFLAAFILSAITLYALRVFRNFQLKDHRFTSLLIGLLILFVFIFINFFGSLELQGEDFIPKSVMVAILVPTFVISISAEFFVQNRIKKRAKGKN